MTNQKKAFDNAEQPDKSMGEAIKAVCFIASFLSFSVCLLRMQTVKVYLAIPVVLIGRLPAILKKPPG